MIGANFVPASIRCSGEIRALRAFFDLLAYETTPIHPLIQAHAGN